MIVQAFSDRTRAWVVGFRALKVRLPVLIAVLAGTLLACALATGCDRPDDVVPLSTDACVHPASSAPVLQLGETSLEERIANYPTVVRARMTSESIEVVAAAGRLQGEYYAAVKFDLAVSEYLNGTGADNITAIWVYGCEFRTRREAEDTLPDIRANRDTQWDDREAVFFLQELQAFPLDVLPRWQPPLEFFPTLQGDNHYYLSSGYWASHRDNYSVSSDDHRLWLPAARDSIGQSAPAWDSQEFLLAHPAQPSSGVYWGSTPAGSTITLGDLKRRIAALTAELNAGTGSAEYKNCVRLKYEFERDDRYFIAEGEGRRVESIYPTHEFDSGQPAGTKIYEAQVAGAESAEKMSRLWFDGQDAALFDVVNGDLVPEHSVFTFTQTVVSTRPIPAGEYKANSNFRRFVFIPCNHVFAYEMTVTVTAPEGAVHEAFFDPVAIGAGVGADGSSGVLKPSSFSVEGVGATDIGRVWWASTSTGSGQAGTVMMDVSPPVELADHHIDFIAMDGSVALRLDFDEALQAVDEGVRTLKWGVCEQPWNDGDLLMLRISESASELTGATTSNEPCSAAPTSSDAYHELVGSSIEAMRGLDSYTFTEQGSVHDTGSEWEPVLERRGPRYAFSGTGAFTTPDRLRREGIHHESFGDMVEYRAVRIDGSYYARNPETHEWEPEAWWLLPRVHRFSMERSLVDQLSRVLLGLDNRTPPRDYSVDIRDARLGGVDVEHITCNEIRLGTSNCQYQRRYDTRMNTWIGAADRLIRRIEWKESFSVVPDRRPIDEDTVCPDIGLDPSMGSTVEWSLEFTGFDLDVSLDAPES